MLWDEDTLVRKPWVDGDIAGAVLSGQWQQEAV